jgi:hypothetical protein
LAWRKEALSNSSEPSTFDDGARCDFPRLVFTTRGVEAGVGQHKPRHRLASDEVRLDNLIHVGRGYAAIPHGFGIDDKIRPMLALIKAPGLVGPNFAFQSTFRQLLFEELLQFSPGLRIAATSRVSSRPLVAANEDVFLKLGHSKTVQDFRLAVRGFAKSSLQLKMSVS